MKKIIVTDNLYSLEKILDNYKIKYSDCSNYKEIKKYELLVIKIDEIDDLNKLDIEPSIVFISKIEKRYEYKKLIKYLKTLKNKTLIINDTNKYLKKIFLKNLDIYRYGNNIYDDIEYIKKDDKIIIKYFDRYTLNTTNENIIGYIIIGLLFGIEIVDIIKNIEKTS